MPHVLHVSHANVTDRDGAVEIIALNLDSLFSVNKFLVDGGYTGKKLAGRAQELLPDVEVEAVKRNELHNFKVLSKRWIVERSFGWLEKHRRRWKNCERKLHTSLEMTVLAFSSILMRGY